MLHESTEQVGETLYKCGWGNRVQIPCAILFGMMFYWDW